MINIEQIKADIYALYEECLDATEPFHRKLDLFLVPQTVIQAVLEATGIDLTDHWVCIDNYGIQHTLEHHGNPITEAKRGQIAVEKEDFVRFLDVFLEPDVLKLAGETKRTHLPLLQFEKIIQHRKIVVKEVRTVTSTKKKKVSRIVFHTLYKIKKSDK
jgi:phage-Barnase-EndoU-ColicinE5/D-RelE like nuclease3